MVGGIGKRSGEGNGMADRRDLAWGEAAEGRAVGIREVPNGTLGTDDAVGRAVLRNGPGVQMMR